MVVKIGQEAEPPSGSRQSIFMIGQDGGGNWVVQDLSGVHGGLFIDRASALRYVGSEGGDCRQVVVMVSGVFELDMTRAAGTTPRQHFADLRREKRAA
jgi:hypothetical protein